jgi:hypothetical protein
MLKMLAEFTKWIHICMILFVLLGHVLLPVAYLKYYIILVILILLDWNDADGMCTLTKVEHYFRTGNWVSQSPLEGGPEFFRPLVNRVFHMNLNRTQADRLNNFIFIACLLIAVLRNLQKK